MVALPKLTKEGYRILTYRLQIYNISHIIFSNGVKVSTRAQPLENLTDGSDVLLTNIFKLINSQTVNFLIIIVAGVQYV